MNRGQKIPSIPIFELKHPRSLLEEKARDPGTYSKGYENNAISPGELKFPSFAKCLVPITAQELWKRGWPTYIGLDLAGDKRDPAKAGNAIVAVGREPGTGRRALLEVRTGNWTSPMTAAVLNEVHGHHNVQFVQVENNGYQQSLIDWVRHEKSDFADLWLKIEAFTTGTNKANPEYGLPGLEVEFKNLGWIFPHSEWDGHPSTCVCDWCRLAREFLMYPRAATTDIVMAAWFARDAANKWGFDGAAGGGLGNLNRR